MLFWVSGQAAQPFPGPDLSLQGKAKECYSPHALSLWSSSTPAAGGGAQWERADVLVKP